MPERRVDAGDAVVGGQDLEAAATEVQRVELARVGRVVDDENDARADTAGLCIRIWSRLRGQQGLDYVRY
jgi:hypothetical protein